MYPRAVEILLEWFVETLTVHRLKIADMISETLRSTNPMESVNSICHGIIRRMTNFRDGGMALRHAAA